MNVIVADNDTIPPGFKMPDQTNGPEGAYLINLLGEVFDKWADYPPNSYPSQSIFTINYQINEMKNKFEAIDLIKSWQHEDEFDQTEPWQDLRDNLENNRHSNRKLFGDS